ncbi:MAG TPA: hypothetical protein VN213_09995 [Solirubrobacteraceae bacterium]|nr:hypothetical protein [Solirubrobacteraceae bacterium]
MTRAVRDLLIGLALTLVAFAGVLWQLEQSGALRPADARAAAAREEQVSLPRLICPLH